MSLLVESLDWRPGDNAVLEHVKFQDESREAFHVAALQTQIARSANYLFHSIVTGARLSRALVAWFWQQPYQKTPVRWGTTLHDRFMLPHFLWADFLQIVDDLKAAGLPIAAAEWEQAMDDSIAEIEGALATLGTGSPWSADTKVSDDFLTPLFKAFYKQLGLM